MADLSSLFDQLLDMVRIPFLTSPRYAVPAVQRDHVAQRLAHLEARPLQPWQVPGFEPGSYTLRLHGEVHQDLEQAARFWDGKHPGLGDTFILQLYQAFQELTHQPYHFATYGEVYCASLKTVPALVHYLKDPQQQQLVIISLSSEGLKFHRWGPEWKQYQ